MNAEWLDTDAIQAIEDRARSAHSGNWEAGRTDDGKWGVADSRLLNMFCEDNWGAIVVGMEMSEANAKHIAGKDPGTTLALLGEIKRLRSVVES